MSSQSILCLLTEDLLLRVYTKLCDKSDRKAWRRVCKEFYLVDSVARRTLRVLRVEFLLSLLAKFRNLEALDFSVCPRIDDGTVSVLLSRASLGWGRRLKNLILKRANGLSYSGLERLIRACPNLEAVDVSYCLRFGDREASAISNAKGLRELRMDKCLEVTDVGLAKIVVGCGKLEYLSLKWCLEISDLGIELLCKKCLNLKALDVSYLKVTNESLYSIASLQRLEFLAVVGCPSVDDFGLQFLENGCPLLKAVDISRCDSITSSGLNYIIRGHNGLEHLDAGYCFSELCPSFIYGLKNLKNLKTIRLDGARLSDSCFQDLSDHFKSLCEIGLSKCIGVTNTGIFQLLFGCVSLKILNLTCCRSITDATISVIAVSCGKLRSLKLESCNMITERSLDQLGSRCSLLEELDLTDCCGVNDRGLKYLSRCSQLFCLKLGLCANISDKGLVEIARHCAKICELDLYRCMNIGDDGLQALSSGCKKLMKLNLSYCSGVTDRGMEYISGLEELSDLEMRGLENVTCVGLAAIASGCKRMSDLDIKHCRKIDDSGFWALACCAQNLRQLNISYCAISDVGLCMVMGNLTRLQDAKLVHLSRVTVKGFELALRACCIRIKKVKLLASLRHFLSSEILGTLHAKRCKIRWD